MKVWITKYLFTDGIYEADAEVDKATAKVKGKDWYQSYFHANEWHASLHAAQDHARKMIAAKRKSIAKQLAKIEKLEKSLS